MATTRKIETITLYIKDDGTVGRVEASTKITQTSDGVTGNYDKHYSVRYEDMGPGAKSVVDGFLGSVESFIDTTEPIV